MSDIAAALSAADAGPADSAVLTGGNHEALIARSAGTSLSGEMISARRRG